METSDAFHDPVAESLVGLRRSCVSTVGTVQAAYAIDLAIRLVVLSVDGTVFVDFSEQGCETRGQTQICFESGLVQFVLKKWLYMEVALSGCKLLGAVVVSCLLCVLSKPGRLYKACDHLQPVLASQQMLTFVSISLFIFYFGGVHSYLHKATKYIYSASVVVSVLPFLFVEVPRRRLEGMRAQIQQLKERESARDRTDDLPRVRYADIESDPGGFQEPGCPICLEDFSADESLAKLACGHLFHVHCIRVWLAGGFQCGCPMRCDDVPAPAPVPEAVGAASAASRRRRRRHQLWARQLQSTRRGGP